MRGSDSRGRSSRHRVRTLHSVDPSALATLSGLAGVVVGAGAILATRRSERVQRTIPAEEQRDALPEGVSAVLAALRSSAIVVDSSGSVVNHSPAAAALGLVRRHELSHAELRELAAGVWADGVTREAAIDLPRNASGSGILHTRTRAAMLGAHHVLLLVDDQTQARRVEEVRRDFVANVSHELKTPVGGLALLAEAVQDAQDDPEAVARFAKKMRKEAARLTRLVKEIVDLSRLQADAALDDPRLVDIEAVVLEAVDHSRTSAELKEVDFDVRTEPGVFVYGTEDLLVTAVRNLLANAVTYSEAGSRVAISSRLSADKTIAEIAVTDHGAGIPATAQGRVFERFYRVDAARSRSTGGTGLGLAIVKHVCENAGGEVSVWSEEGRGSTFTIRLPNVPDPQVRQGEPA